MPHIQTLQGKKRTNVNVKISKSVKENVKVEGPETRPCVDEAKQKRPYNPDYAEKPKCRPRLDRKHEDSSDSSISSLELNSPQSNKPNMEKNRKLGAARNEKENPRINIKERYHVSASVTSQ